MGQEQGRARVTPWAPLCQEDHITIIPHPRRGVTQPLGDLSLSFLGPLDWPPAACRPAHMTRPTQQCVDTGPVLDIDWCPHDASHCQRSEDCTVMVRRGTVAGWSLMI